jgi:cytochrome c biogenesis protein CcdA
MCLNVISPCCFHDITKITKYSVQTQLSISQEIIYKPRLKYYEKKMKKSTAVFVSDFETYNTML